MIEREDQLEGRRLGLDDTFQFQCRPGLDCFNSCCHNKRLSLLPYDLLRLRRGLGKPSQEILEQLVELEIDPSSGWPMLRLKLDLEGRCHLVREDGCSVYQHRPTCCRIFPLARAVAPGGDGGPRELFLAPEADPSCLGWQEPHELTVRDYLEEQQLTPYRAANNRILGLFMHPKRPDSMTLDPRQTHAVIMALYNLDVFREAVAADGFAARFNFAPERIEHARQSDEALLELGQDWLAALLFTA